MITLALALSVGTMPLNRPINQYLYALPSRSLMRKQKHPFVPLRGYLIPGHCSHLHPSAHMVHVEGYAHLTHHGLVVVFDPSAVAVESIFNNKIISISLEVCLFCCSSVLNKIPNNNRNNFDCLYLSFPLDRGNTS